MWGYPFDQVLCYQVIACVIVADVARILLRRWFSIVQSQSPRNFALHSSTKVEGAIRTIYMIMGSKTAHIIAIILPPQPLLIIPFIKS